MGSIPNQSPFSKEQNGELAVDSALRLKIQIAAVSGGLSIPTTGGGTGGGGTVTIGGVVAGISTALPVSIRGGTTNQNVKLNGIASLSTALPVSIRGGSTNQDVRIAAVSATIPVAEAAYTGSILSGITVLSSAVSHSKVAIAAQGASTSTRVHGFSIYNEGANARRFYLQFGATAFWKGGLASGAAFNWNVVGGFPKSAANKSVIARINGGGTAVVTVLYRKV